LKNYIYELSYDISADLPDLTQHRGDMILMSSTIPVEIPKTIGKIIKPEHVTRSEFKSEIEFEVNLIYGQFDEMIETINNQNKRIKDLESKQPQTKVSPVEQRAEILHTKTMKANSLNSRQVMHILGVKQHIQAIRAMKYTAIIHSDDIEIVKSDISNKSYSLRRRIDSSINPYSVRV
jgi:hypothetical protein